MIIEIEGGRPGGSEPGLPIVRSIPNLSPCLLEGPNGIGKTLAVNLLRLVCGQQPWLGENALWESLREALATSEIAIRVAGLRCGRDIEAVLRPSEWPPEPQAVIGDWLGSVTLGGDAVTPTDISQFFTVERFGGNEDLERVMELELQGTGAHLRATARALEGPIDATLAQLDTVSEVLGPAQPEVRAGLQKTLEAKQAQMAQMDGQLDEARAARELASEALRLRAKLDQFETKPEALKEDLEAQQQRVQELQSQRDALDEEIATLLTNLKPRGDLEEALSEAQELLTQREKRLDRQRKLLDELTERLGDRNRKADLGAELKAIADQIARDRSALLSIDRSGRVLEAIDEVLPSVSAAERDGIGDETIAELTDSTVSVGHLQLGLSRREVSLRTAPMDESAADLRAEIDANAARSELLTEALKAAKAVERSEQLVSEAGEAVRHARSGIAGASEALEEYDRMVGSRSELQEELAEVVGAVVRLRAELGLPATESKEDLQRETARLAGELGVRIDQLEAKWGTLDAEVSAGEAALLVARQETTSLQTELGSIDSELRIANRRIRADPSLAWLADLLEGQPKTDDGIADLKTLARFGEASTRAEARVRQTRDTLDALSRLIDVWAAGDRPGEETWLLGLDNLLSKALSEQLRRRLDTEPIREALFEGSPLVTLDLNNRTLAWEAEGGIVHRPLEGFSTGQQAFAFTQARILGLESLTEGRDRLLVLDEFGAFVAADRLDELASFLATEQVAQRASQVLVVLPLQTDYEADRNETTGQLRARYDERVKQLQDSGYIAEEFSFGSRE